MRWRAGWLAAMAAVGASTAAGQSLAHKGWAGNGIVVAPWWQGAVFYAIGSEEMRTDGGEDGQRALQEQLDGLQEMGVDALVLEGQVPVGRESESRKPESGEQRAEGAFDALVGEATRRRLRVVVDLPVRSGESGTELANGAQYWLSRGAAGLRLVMTEGGCTRISDASCRAPATTSFSEVERVVAGFSGQRVLLWDVPGAALRDATPVRTRRHARRGLKTAPAAPLGRVVVDHWMQGWPLLDAAGLRRVLAAEMASAGRMVEGAGAPRLIDAEDVRVARARPGGEDAAAEKRVAAAVMLGLAAPLLYARQEGGDDPAKWYTVLGAIRHGSAALREGRMELLDVGDPNVVAWVRVAGRSGLVSPPAVVVENFSDRPITLRLGAALRRAGVKVGSGVLLVAAQAGDGEQAGTARVDDLTVNAGGVFVGGLEGAPGLEAEPEPVRKRRR